MDRIDLTVQVPAVDPADLTSSSIGESSEAVRHRVVVARERQIARFAGSGALTNARMTRADLEQHARLDEPARRLLILACKRLAVTARGFDRIRRTSRTIADLDASETIRERHVAEAVQYRPMPELHDR